MPSFDEDLDAIFDINGPFSTCAEFDVNGTPLCVSGHFTDASDAVVMYGQVEIEAQKPTFVCKTSDLTTVRNQMSVTINETVYKVEKLAKIGHGATVVYLQTPR